MPIPEHDHEAARIIQGIVQLAGGRFESATNLNKAYYWAHRLHWRDQNGLLTRRERLARLPHGPGIDGFQALLASMKEEGLISIERGGGDYEKTVYHLHKPVELTDAECAAIQEAVRKVDGRSATSVRDESHRESRAWREGVNGLPIDPYYDEISERDLGRIRRSQKDLRNVVERVFGTGGG